MRVPKTLTKTADGYGLSVLRYGGTYYLTNDADNILFQLSCWRDRLSKNRLVYATHALFNDSPPDNRFLKLSDAIKYIHEKMKGIEDPQLIRTGFSLV